MLQKKQDILSREIFYSKLKTEYLASVWRNFLKKIVKGKRKILKFLMADFFHGFFQTTNIHLP